MDTLSDTFNLFFGGDDEPETKACTDCDGTDNLTVLYTKESGNAVWICATCQARRDREAKERHEREAGRVRTMAARDEWEEE